MARRRGKGIRKAAATTASTSAAARPPEVDTPVVEPAIPETLPVVIPVPSPPLPDAGVVLAPTHKKFGKFRCLLGEGASSSPSSSSDDQTPLVEDWGAAGVVAEEVILTQDMDLSQGAEVVLVAQEEEISMEVSQVDAEQVIACEMTTVEDEAVLTAADVTEKQPASETTEKTADIQPSFERLTIIPEDPPVEVPGLQDDNVSKTDVTPVVEQPSETTQDSQGSIDADSSSSQTAVLEGTESKESKGEGTDTDTSSSSNTHSAASSTSSAPMTRRRSSRIRNLQESLASSREAPTQAACPPAAPAVTTNTELSSIEEESSTLNPSSPVSLLPPQAPPPSSKPVKVKSRWRRSSELEMNVTPNTSTCNSPLPCPSPPSGPSSVQSSPQHTPSSMELDSKPAVLPADEERLRSYGHLDENVYLTERERNKDTKRMVCDCFLTKEEMAKGELGCGEDCLNRLLMIECGSRCPLGDQCSNKRFQRMEHSPLEIFRTEKKGFGLRVTADVQSGDFLTEYVGEVLDPKEFRRRAKEYAKDKNRHYYFMALKSDAIIDATLKGNHSRFINHSCDPNAETQKWTVNGELRIGFFATKNIAAGEEVTFDYQFQRYGKEAQRCYCESSNCRGWIGEDPDKEEKEEKDEKDEKDEKPRSQSRKGSDRKDKRKDRSKQLSSGKDVKDLLEDMDLEQEVENLSSSGLKNQAHTLTLCRLMVRVEDRESRGRLLQLLRTAEPACRRLFLDYHGLRLIWSWMIDTDSSLRSEIMETLAQLPIPNKTVLQDSKVLAVIERWASDTPVRSPDESSTPAGDSTIPKVEPVPATLKEGEAVMEGVQEEKPKDQEPGEEEEESNEDSKSALERRAEDSEMARKLLESWSGLKEVFRIPKKERIEQMKEHEREADRGYKEYLEGSSKPRVDRYRSGLGSSSGANVLSGSNAVAIGVNKRMRDARDSPDNATRKAQRMEDRNLSRLSKYERRQLFELRVEKEDRARREMWEQQQQQQQQMAQANGPYVLDASGVPCYWDPTTGNWHQLPQFPPGHIPEQNGPMPGSHPGSQLAPHQGIEINFNQPHQFDPNRGEYPPNGHPMYDSNHPQHWGLGQTGPGLPQTPQVPIPPIPIPPLPPKWKFAYDSKGQPYYYHVRLRVPQWEPPAFPQPEPPPIQETPSSSESSEDSEDDDDDDEEEEEEEEESLSSEEEAVQDKVEEEPEPEEEEESEEYEEGTKVEQPSEPPETSIGEVEEEETETDLTAKETNVTIETPQTRKDSKRREGLVTEIIISPRREEEEPAVNSNKKYKELKERLRRQKEKEATRKQRTQSSGRSTLSKSSSKSGRERRRDKSKPSAEGDDTLMIDADSDAGRKIKEQFRLKMAGVMVQCLNPYRKPDCKSARICSTEDFKHLARKLTHFVMLKELKHCRNVSDLVCNDNVKHKARDFVKKYMAKFGVTYQREAEN